MLQCFCEKCWRKATGTLYAAGMLGNAMLGNVTLAFHNYVIKSTCKLPMRFQQHHTLLVHTALWNTVAASSTSCVARSPLCWTFFFLPNQLVKCTALKSCLEDLPRDVQHLGMLLTTCVCLLLLFKYFAMPLVLAAIPLGLGMQILHKYHENAMLISVLYQCITQMHWELLWSLLYIHYICYK